MRNLCLHFANNFQSIVNDYFSQMVIDFLLGNVTAVVFEDFEDNLMSVDPGVSMQKLRQHAIDMCQRIVIADEQEEMIGGWTLLTPQVSNTIKSAPFEESVLVLTDAAAYCCKFDWNIEKISSFEVSQFESCYCARSGGRKSLLLKYFFSSKNRAELLLTAH